MKSTISPLVLASSGAWLFTRSQALGIKGGNSLHAPAVFNMFSFSDSYTETGFNYKGLQPNVSNPIGNPTFPGDTTTGGSNWVDFTVATYNESLVLSYNFARAGATVDNAIIPAYLETVPSLVSQTSEFTTHYGPKAASFANWTSDNSLFTVWFGINDIMNGFDPTNWTTVAPTIISSYMAQVQILYDSGARYFLFLSISPIQRTPDLLAKNSTQRLGITQAVATYNMLLLRAVDEFQSASQNATTWLLNSTVPFDTVLNNPAAYGAPNNTCYSSTGTKCSWWNDFHPGQAIHRLLAQLVNALTGL